MLIFIRENNRWGDDATRVSGKRCYKIEQVVYCNKIYNIKANSEGQNSQVGMEKKAY